MLGGNGGGNDGGGGGGGGRWTVRTRCTGGPWRRTRAGAVE
jgi:hypothetical protein